MNNTDTTEVTTENSFLDAFWAFLNYALNKYMPFAFVCFLSFYTIGFDTWESYAIVGFMMFSNHYNFKCGYAHAILDNGFEEPEEKNEEDL